MVAADCRPQGGSRVVGEVPPKPIYPANKSEGRSATSASTITLTAASRISSKETTKTVKNTKEEDSKQVLPDGPAALGRGQRTYVSPSGKRLESRPARLKGKSTNTATKDSPPIPHTNFLDVALRAVPKRGLEEKTEENLTHLERENQRFLRDEISKRLTNLVRGDRNRDRDNYESGDFDRIDLPTEADLQYQFDDTMTMAEDVKRRLAEAQVRYRTPSLEVNGFRNAMAQCYKDNPQNALACNKYVREFAASVDSHRSSRLYKR